MKLYSILPFALGLACFLFFISCQKEEVSLRTVSVADFAAFVEATGYVTDAEKFAWSIVQRTVYDFETVENIDWRCPDGITEADAAYAVTQVSYQDAMAYADWANVRLPSYQEYWKIVQSDTRPINEGGTTILPIAQVNFVGNVWDMIDAGTSPDVRLAGGSYLCNKTTCDGTNERRLLHVDRITGNTHIGFSVLKK